MTHMLILHLLRCTVPDVSFYVGKIIIPVLHIIASFNYIQFVPHFHHILECRYIILAAKQNNLIYSYSSNIKIKITSILVSFIILITTSFFRCSAIAQNDQSL